MNAVKDIRSLKETDILTFDSNDIHINPVSTLDPETATVKIHRSYAHPGGVYAYRIEYRGHALVYATDVEGYVGGDRRLANFAHGADVLIHDAQYSEEHYRGQAPGLPPTQGYGHSTIQMACELAAAAQVRELVLFHHDPSYADETIDRLGIQAQGLFSNVHAAYEGLVMDIEGERLQAVKPQVEVMSAVATAR